jgi:hypothetical protein
MSDAVTNFSDFVDGVENFSSLKPTDKILHTMWFLHRRRGVEAIPNRMLRLCFNEIHSVAPDFSVYLPRMAAKKPPLVLGNAAGYRLEGQVRKRLDQSLGETQSTIQISGLLKGILNQVTNADERTFVEETFRCYRVGAFRASIVMVWNVAYDHLRKWVFADTMRIAAFNDAITKKYPKKTLTILSITDFDDLKEFEFLEITQTAKLLSKNLVEMLKEKLKRRNAAAHPSSIRFSQAQADDVITDLISNVVARLS